MSKITSKKFYEIDSRSQILQNFLTVFLLTHFCKLDHFITVQKNTTAPKRSSLQKSEQIYPQIRSRKFTVFVDLDDLDREDGEQPRYVADGSDLGSML